MIFRETSLPGAIIIEPERSEDERGFFARTWCRHEFAAHGLNPGLAQCSFSFTHKRGTLRGMHYQIVPYEETKLVRCTAGAIYDVVIDLRPTSPTFKQHLSIILTSDNKRAIYIPEGLAHGFQTLEDNTEVLYQTSEFHAPDYARGIRWNDPAFGIAWPIANPILCDRDRQYPDFV